MLSAPLVGKGFQGDVSRPNQFVSQLGSLGLVIAVADPHLNLQLLLTKKPDRGNKYQGQGG